MASEKQQQDFLISYIKKSCRWRSLKWNTDIKPSLPITAWAVLCESAALTTEMPHWETFCHVLLQQQLKKSAEFAWYSLAIYYKIGKMKDKSCLLERKMQKKKWSHVSLLTIIFLLKASEVERHSSWKARRVEAMKLKLQIMKDCSAKGVCMCGLVWNFKPAQL